MPVQRYVKTEKRDYMCTTIHTNMNITDKYKPRLQFCIRYGHVFLLRPIRQADGLPDITTGETVEQNYIGQKPIRDTLGG